MESVVDVENFGRLLEVSALEPQGLSRCRTVPLGLGECTANQVSSIDINGRMVGQPRVCLRCRDAAPITSWGGQ